MVFKRASIFHGSGESCQLLSKLRLLNDIIIVIIFAPFMIPSPALESIKDETKAKAFPKIIFYYSGISSKTVINSSPEVFL